MCQISEFMYTCLYFIVADSLGFFHILVSCLCLVWKFCVQKQIQSREQSGPTPHQQISNFS